MQFLNSDLARLPRGLVVFLRGRGSASVRAAAYFVEIAKSAGCTQKSVADVFNISQPALSLAIKRHIAGNMKPARRPRFLNDEESEVLYQMIHLKVVNLDAPTVKEVQNLALEVKCRSGCDHANIPSYRWVKIWMKMMNLVLRNAIVGPHSSFFIDPEQVRRFLFNYSSWIQINGEDPNMIWNFDESGVVINPRTPKLMVVTIPKIQRPSHRTPTLRLRVTLGVSGSASGLSTRVQCIVPNSGWKRVFRKLFVAVKIHPLQSGSGWQSKVSFRWWVDQVFIPGLNELGMLGTHRVLLVLDGHSSRRDDEAIRHLLENNIDALVLPANSSKYLQPLDQVAFSVLKVRIRRSLNSLTKVEFLEMLEDSLNSALTRSTLRAGWKKSNLLPYHPERIHDIVPVISPPSKRRKEHLAPLGAGFWLSLCKTKSLYSALLRN